MLRDVTSAGVGAVIEAQDQRDNLGRISSAEYRDSKANNKVAWISGLAALQFFRTNVGGSLGEQRVEGDLR